MMGENEEKRVDGTTVKCECCGSVLNFDWIKFGRGICPICSAIESFRKLNIFDKEFKWYISCDDSSPLFFMRTVTYERR